MKNVHKIRGKREFLFDDRELFVLSFGAAIICVLIFVLGFLVGQGIQQNTLAQTMMAHPEGTPLDGAYPEGIEEPLLTDSVASVSNAENPPAFQEDLSAEDPASDKTSQSSYFTVLPDREEYVEVEATPVKPTDPQAEPLEEQIPEPAAGSPGQDTLEEPAAQASTPVSTAGRQNTAVAPVLPNVPRSPTDEMHVGRPTIGMNESAGLNGPIYSVQVASSPSREDSERLQQKFINLGYESQVMVADLGTRGIWYRVRVGNLATKEEAEQMRRDILNRASHLAKEPYVIKVSD